MFLLTYFLIAVPAQDASDRAVQQARELSGVQAAKTDVYADLEIFAHSQPTAHRIKVLVAEAEALFRRGNSAVDSGDGSYAAALKSYNAALIKLRAADAVKPVRPLHYLGGGASVIASPPPAPKAGAPPEVTHEGLALMHE